MAKKLGVKYVCSACGAASSSWTGRCRVCGEWNTLSEQVEVATATAGISGKRLKTEAVTEAVKAKIARLPPDWLILTLFWAAAWCPGA